MITIGTSHFVSFQSACSYYKEYGLDREDVSRKLAEGEIYIGAPPVKPHYEIGLTDRGRRYVYKERPYALTRIGHKDKELEK